jgi:hypothetical protein
MTLGDSSWPRPGLDIVADLTDLANLLENGPYVRLKTQRDGLRAAAAEIVRLRNLLDLAGVGYSK